MAQRFSRFLCRSKKGVWRSQPRARLAPYRPWLLPREKAPSLSAEATFDIFPPLGPIQTAAPAMGGEGGPGGQPNEAWDEGGACSSCDLLPRPAAPRARALQLSPGMLAHRLVGWLGLNRKAGRRPTSARARLSPDSRGAAAGDEGLQEARRSASAVDMLEDIAGSSEARPVFASRTRACAACARPRLLVCPFVPRLHSANACAVGWWDFLSLYAVRQNRF